MMVAFKEFADALDQRLRESWTHAELRELRLDTTAEDVVAWQRGRYAVWLHKRSDYTALIERVATVGKDGMSGIAPEGRDLQTPIPMNEHGLEEAVRFLDWLRTIKNP
jgi:hypothetical protein